MSCGTHEVLYGTYDASLSAYNFSVVIAELHATTFCRARYTGCYTPINST